MHRLFLIGSLILLTSCNQFALLASAGSIGLSQNTYAKAYNQDKEFFRFYRSLQAYKESFKDKEDVLILEPDGEFFRYLKGSQGQ